MSPEPPEEAVAPAKRVTLPRPGHADLAGMQKYAFDDLRNVLERSSARETTARVAAGGIAKKLLSEFGVEIRSAVYRIGNTAYEKEKAALDAAKADDSDVRCPDEEVSEKDEGRDRRGRYARDALGGEYVVVAEGCPPGLGSYVDWREKLDARLAHAILSINAMKGVEFGMGFEVARHRSSEVQDEILLEDGRIVRASNRLGGLEGGMSNGEPIIVSAAMKPISTIAQALRTVDLSTGEPARAFRERADSCAVPAAAVIAESMVAVVLADAFLEKFGGDNMTDLHAFYDALHRPYKSPPPGAQMARTAERSRPEKGPVALVGFMGSGKSTVGRLLARRLGWRLIDLDREIEARDGRRIPDIFSSCGETYFRELESRLLDEALAGKTSGRPCVISCGGGG